MYAVFAKAKREIEALNARLLLSAEQIAPDFRTPQGNVSAMNDTEKAGNIGLSRYVPFAARNCSVCELCLWRPTVGHGNGVRR